MDPSDTRLSMWLDATLVEYQTLREEILQGLFNMNRGLQYGVTSLLTLAALAVGVYARYQPGTPQHDRDLVWLAAVTLVVLVPAVACHWALDWVRNVRCVSRIGD